MTPCRVVPRFIHPSRLRGKIAIFDRGWYNPAGAEYVTGFSSKAQHRRFLGVCPEFERFVVDGGILLMTHRFEATQPAS
jgi:polyphosphate kinase 2 (PPK2 family)